MPTMRLLSAAMLALLALSACKGEQKPVAAASGTAGGEILEHSASDAMLPLDQVRSQPPLAPKSETSTAPDAASGKPSSHPKPAHAAAPKAEAPVPTPKPAPAAAETAGN